MAKDKNYQTTRSKTTHKLIHHYFHKNNKLLSMNLNNNYKLTNGMIMLAITYLKIILMKNISRKELESNQSKSMKRNF